MVQWGRDPAGDSPATAEFQAYQYSIPKRGGIIISSGCTHVLLVKSSHRSQWYFPKGKINELESDTACAAREVRACSPCTKDAARGRGVRVV